MKNIKQDVRKAADQVGEELMKETSGAFQELTKKSAKDGLSIKVLSGVSDEKEEAVYGQAYLLYNAGRYKDAIEIFRVLIMLNSTEPKYMMGLAACFHLMKAYDAAISSYTLVSFLDPENPIPYFHTSDCALQLGDKMGAMVALQMAIKRAENKPEFKTLKERAEITLNGIKKDIAQQSVEE